MCEPVITSSRPSSRWPLRRYRVPRRLPTASAVVDATPGVLVIEGVCHGYPRKTQINVIATDAMVIASSTARHTRSKRRSVNSKARSLSSISSRLLCEGPAIAPEAHTLAALPNQCCASWTRSTDQL
jgi:hypothetical protein